MARILKPTNHNIKRSRNSINSLPIYKVDTVICSVYNRMRFFPKAVKNYHLSPVFDIEKSNNLLHHYKSLPKLDYKERLLTISNSLLAYYKNTDSIYENAILLQELGYQDEALIEYRRWRNLTYETQEQTNNFIAYNQIAKCDKTHVTLVTSDNKTEKKFPIEFVSKTIGVKSSTIRKFVAMVAFLVGLNSVKANDSQIKNSTVLVEEKPDSLAAMPYVASAQQKVPDDQYSKMNSKEQWEYLQSTKNDSYVLKSTTVVGVPDSEWQNQHQKPDVHFKYLGKGEYEYYGSGGDLNEQAILDGSTKGEYDVNVDGVVNSTDAQIITDYKNGTAKIIGRDFYSSNTTDEEKRQWVSNFYNNVHIPIINHPAMPGWVCSNYSDQGIIGIKGMSDVQTFLDKYYAGWTGHPINTEVNALANIQANEASLTTLSGVAHSVIAIPIGNDLTQLSNWKFIDGATGEDAGMGSKYMQPGKKVSIKWEGVTQTWGAIRGPPIIDFIPNEDGTASITWQNPDYNFTRPAENQAPVVTSNLTESNAEYYSTITNEALFPAPTITDDNDPNPTIESSFSSTQSESGVNKYRYSVTKTTTATDNQGAVGTLEEIVSVDDTTIPEFNVSSTYVKIGQNDDPFVEAKKLINYTYDNAEVVDTLVTHAYDNLYDLQVEDAVGNLSNKIQVEVDNSTGIEDIEGTNRGIDLEMQNPITNSTPYMNIATTNPGITKLEVFDISGRKLEEKVFTTSYGDNILNIDLANLQTGIYIFKVTDCMGNSDVERIVKD